MRQATDDECNRLNRDGLLYNEDMNVRYPFQKMCRLFGRAYIEYLQCSHAVTVRLSGCCTEEEWARINGGVPASFIEKVVKPAGDYWISQVS